MTLTPADADSRQADVLAAMAWLGHAFGGHTPEVVARCLSLYRRHDCPWCPLAPLNARKQHARAVPKGSREAVRQVLLALLAAGRVANARDPYGKQLWVLVDQSAVDATPANPTPTL